MLTHRHSTSDAILSFLVIFAPAGFDTIGLGPGIGLVGSLHADLLLRECAVWFLFTRVSLDRVGSDENTPIYV